MSELPAGWQQSNLEALARAVGGGTPSKAEASNWVNGTVPWVSPKDMKRFSIAASEDRISAAAAERLSLVPTNSVLTVVRSGILSRTLPVALNAIPVTVNQDLRAFVPEPGVSAAYLAWQLVAKEQEILASCSKHGTTVASIEGPALSRFPITLAPSQEQTRIVAKLEELLSDLDAGVAELKAAQKKLAQYRQSLLKAAVEGMLTAEWRRHNPPKETGAELLARILTERRVRWETKQLAKFKGQGKALPADWRSKYPMPEAAKFTELPVLPEDWVWATIDQLASVGTGVTPLRSKIAYFQDGTIPWVTSGALNQEIVTDAAEKVSELAVQECRLEVFPKGALLVAMYGEGKTRGKCSELGISATINQAIAAIVLEPGAQSCKPYLKAFLLNSYEKMRQQASGGVQPNLNLQIIKSIAVPLPPIVEQQAVMVALSEQLQSVADQKAATELALKQSTAQRQNILRAAFAGQLVPQDPNDEPASVLLQRIRAERAAGEQKRSQRKTRAVRENA